MTAFPPEVQLDEYILNNITMLGYDLNEVVVALHSPEYGAGSLGGRVPARLPAVR
jgi:hypothetical protein